MQSLRTCLLFIILLTGLTKRSLAQTESHTWETHLNLRGISGLINGESAGFLLKRRIGEKTFARLGLQGYELSRQQTGVLGNHIVTRRFLVQTRPGIEWRTTINDKFYFLRGADLIYGYSGSDNIPPTADQYTERQRATDLGLSPFLGIHYTVNAHFGILAEAHINAFSQFIKNRIDNDINSTYPNRIETRTDTLIEFQPFQNITVCFTF
jgi:hypothetical protein